jgi:hypothetical protein
MEMEIGLVLLLVAIHVLALLFWMTLLLKGRPAGKRGPGGGAGNLKDARSSWKSPRFGAQPPTQQQQERKWQTPAEIMAAWRKSHADKERLGKV